MPQWHVKECYVPPVPTLPVAGALCQASPPSSPVPCPGSGHCDRSQTPIMCLHQAACPLALIPGAVRVQSCTLPRKMPRIVVPGSGYVPQYIHTLMGFEEVRWLHGSANSTGNYSGRRVVSLYFLPSSNASAVAIFPHFIYIYIYKEKERASD